MWKRYLSLFCLVLLPASFLLQCGCSKPAEPTQDASTTTFPDPQARKHTAPGSAPSSDKK